MLCYFTFCFLAVLWSKQHYQEMQWIVGLINAWSILSFALLVISHPQHCWSCGGLMMDALAKNYTQASCFRMNLSNSRSHLLCDAWQSLMMSHVVMSQSYHSVQASTRTLHPTILFVFRVCSVSFHHGFLSSFSATAHPLFSSHCNS